MFNKTKYLILILFLLFLPGFASAGIPILDEIIGSHEVWLEAVEEATAPIMAFIIKVIILYAIGLGSLLLSSTFLQHAITQQSEWLSLRGNDMVQAGFQFTSGLANMFLILILVVLAFAIILRIESFQVKKALPRLLIVALLLNFSLLFIGMLVDISQVIYETILTGVGTTGETAFGTVLRPLFDAGGKNLTQMLLWLSATAGSFVIPIGGPAAQLSIVLLLGTWHLPNIILWTFQMVIFFFLAGMFLLYLFIFMSRVFVVQLLATIAPLAFLCLILPQTKKYFNMWFKMLLGWIFAGILCLFFLILGFGLMNFLLPEKGLVTPLFIFTWFKFDEYLFYYFGLFILLALLLHICKKILPEGVQAFMDLGRNIGMTIWGRGLKPFGGAVRRQASWAAVKQVEREKAITAERPLRGWEKAEKKVGWAIRGVHQLAGTTPRLEMEKEEEKWVKQYKERFGENVEAAWEVFRARPTLREEVVAARHDYLTQAGGREGIEQLSEKQQLRGMRALVSVAPKKVAEVAQYKPEFVFHPEIGELVQRAIVPKGVDDKDVQELTKQGVETAKAIRETAIKRVVGEWKKENIGRILTKEIMESEGKEFKEIRKIMIKFKPWSFMEAIGREMRADYIEKLQKETEGLGKDVVEKTNPTWIRAPERPAGQLLMRPWSWSKKRGRKT